MKNSKRALGLKALSFILVAALFFSISVPAFADYEPQFYVDFIGDDAVAITGVDLDTSVDSTLFIPAEIDGTKLLKSAAELLPIMTVLRQLRFRKA